MTKSVQEVHASGILLDGAHRKIPGFETGALRGDKRFEIINFTAMNLFGGAQNNIGSIPAPFDYTVVALFFSLAVQPGTAAATLNIGTRASTTKFVNAYSIGTAHATGIKHLMAPSASANDASVGATLTGSAGDILQCSSDGGGTATGLVCAAMIIVPTGT